MSRVDTFNAEIIEKIGLNPSDLTFEQIDLILQPVNAPEDYYMDGEISSNRADREYSIKLANIGLSRDDQVKVLKYYEILI